MGILKGDTNKNNGRGHEVTGEGFIKIEITNDPQGVRCLRCTCDLQMVNRETVLMIAQAACDALDLTSPAGLAELIMFLASSEVSRTEVAPGEDKCN